MNRFHLFVLFTLLLTACVKDVNGDVNSNISPDHKIINVSENAASGRLLVRFATPVQEFSIEGVDLRIEPLFVASSDAKLSRWAIAHFDESLELIDVARKIAADSNVERVEFDVIMKRIKSERVPMPMSRTEPTRAEELPFNDPELSWQWHYHNDGYISEDSTPGADINLLNAWKYTTGDNRIIVAVCDGGIMADHPDLADNMWVNKREQFGLTGVDDDGNGYVDDIHGYNFVNDSGNVTADAHGTHVAGTISAVNNNGYAVCGIAGGTGNGDGVKLMSIQIFENDEGCYSHQIARGFEYAANNGAVLINNSWGFGPGDYSTDGEFEDWDSVLKNAIDYFEQKASLNGVMDGGLAIFAAGNDTYHTANYPGAYHKYICVSAMAANFYAAYYTNYGPGCNITAPGGDSLYASTLCISSTSTTERDGYEYMQGTSMAAPHVTGCAALALSYALKQGYTLTSEELKGLILTSVHDIDQYQTGSRYIFNWNTGAYESIALEPYKGNMGSGYIDAHLLLMQMEGTPCIYLTTSNDYQYLELDNYFGDNSEGLTYQGVTMSSSDMSALGISTSPIIENGKLKIKCSKSGTARISVTAIVGGSVVGGNNSIGGMEVTREFELVVRHSKANNGGWL